LALIGKVPSGTLLGEVCEWYSDFGVSINEMLVEVGKAEEGLNVFDISGLEPILDNLDFVWGHSEAFGQQNISEVFTGGDMEFALISSGKSPLVWSLWSTSWTWALCLDILSE